MISIHVYQTCRINQLYIYTGYWYTLENDWPGTHGLWLWNNLIRKFAQGPWGRRTSLRHVPSANPRYRRLSLLVELLILTDDQVYIFHFLMKIYLTVLGCTKVPDSCKCHWRVRPYFQAPPGFFNLNVRGWFQGTKTTPIASWILNQKASLEIGKSEKQIVKKRAVKSVRSR